jgi:hypothetical protein
MFLELIPRNGYQQLMNGIHVQYGVQWEAERLVQESGGSWSDFHLGDIHKLKGNSFDVIPLLPSIVRNVRERKAREACTLPRPGDAHDVPSPVLCAEMDTEEDSIAARDMRGLGDGRWYGGKLTFAVAVQYQAATGRDADVFAALDSPFSFRLLRVDQSGKSTRLARRFGSRRVLSIRFGSVPSSARTRLFLMFRGRALVLFGRVFRVLFVPPDSDSAVAVETDERAPLGPELRLPLMPSFLELLQGEPSADDNADHFRIQLSRGKARPSNGQVGVAHPAAPFRLDTRNTGRAGRDCRRGRHCVRVRQISE